MHIPTEIILRSVIVYIFILVAIRIFGKKELSQLNTIDLVFILLISNSVQNAMVGPDNSLIGGIIAAASLFALNYLLKLLAFRNKGFSSALQGDPVMLIHEGKVLEGTLHKQRITQSEIEQAAREHGVQSLSEVNLAVLEVDGSISILSENYRRQTKKKHRAHKALSKM